MRGVLRRFFKFLYRHQYGAPSVSIDPSSGLPMARMICKNCGFETDRFVLLDQRSFSFWYRLQGCPGVKK